MFVVLAFIRSCYFTCLSSPVSWARETYVARIRNSVSNIYELLSVSACFLGWLLDDPCPFMFKSVLLSMLKIVKYPFMLIGWLLGDLVPCPFMSKIAILLNLRANHTANMSADFFGQWRRALLQIGPALKWHLAFI